MTFGDELERERERVVRLVRHASVSWAEAMWPSPGHQAITQPF